MEIEVAKRYSFWRQPTGKPFKGDYDKFAPCAHLEKIGTSSKLKGDGIEWAASELTQRENVVRLAFVVMDNDDRELNERDTWAILWKATQAVIKDSGGGVALNPKDILLKADEFAAEFFRKSKNVFEN